MHKKYFYVITCVVVLVILIIGGNYERRSNTSTNNTINNIFRAEKIDLDTNSNSKVKFKITKTFKENGVFLLQSGENTLYLILDGSHVNLNGEAPYFSDVKIESKEDSIMIYFNEELKNYTSNERPQQKLVYKIIKDKEYEYIKIFKNGKKTHFDVIGA